MTLSHDRERVVSRSFNCVQGTSCSYDCRKNTYAVLVLWGKVVPAYPQESHESLPWQRRNYLRGAMLDQLVSAAGFAPTASGDAAAAVAGEEDRGDSVREFLDQQRTGWGAKFGAVFEAILACR